MFAAVGTSKVCPFVSSISGKRARLPSSRPRVEIASRSRAGLYRQLCASAETPSQDPVPFGAAKMLVAPNGTLPPSNFCPISTLTARRSGAAAIQWDAMSKAVTPPMAPAASRLRAGAHTAAPFSRSLAVTSAVGAFRTIGARFAGADSIWGEDGPALSAVFFALTPLV